jgi:hypothetical protein
VKACVLQNAIFDVILGCVPGSTFACTEIAGAVQTQTTTEDKPCPQLTDEPKRDAEVQTETVNFVVQSTVERIMGNSALT